VRDDKCEKGLTATAGRNDSCEKDPTATAGSCKQLIFSVSLMEARIITSPQVNTRKTVACTSPRVSVLFGSLVSPLDLKHGGFVVQSFLLLLLLGLLRPLQHNLLIFRNFGRVGQHRELNKIRACESE
jgi:hypothetical protein